MIFFDIDVSKKKKDIKKEIKIKTDFDYFYNIFNFKSNIILEFDQKEKKEFNFEDIEVVEIYSNNNMTVSKEKKINFKDEKGFSAFLKFREWTYNLNKENQKKVSFNDFEGSVWNLTLGSENPEFPSYLFYLFKSFSDNEVGLLSIISKEKDIFKNSMLKGHYSIFKRIYNKEVSPKEKILNIIEKEVTHENRIYDFKSEEIINLKFFDFLKNKRISTEKYSNNAKIFNIKFFNIEFEKDFFRKGNSYLKRINFAYNYFNDSYFIESLTLFNEKIESEFKINKKNKINIKNKITEYNFSSSHKSINMSGTSILISFLKNDSPIKYYISSSKAASFEIENIFTGNISTFYFPKAFEEFGLRAKIDYQNGEFVLIKKEAKNIQKESKIIYNSLKNKLNKKNTSLIYFILNKKENENKYNNSKIFDKSKMMNIINKYVKNLDNLDDDFINFIIMNHKEFEYLSDFYNWINKVLDKSLSYAQDNFNKKSLKKTKKEMKVILKY